MGGDLRSSWKKINPDHYATIKSFRSRGVLYVSLIYEITDVPFHENGYIGTGVDYEKPSGKDSFRFIFSYPEENPDHLPKIASIIQEKDETRETPLTKNEAIYEKCDNACYYLIRIDHHVCLVVISERMERADSGTLEFITTLAKKLSGLEVLNILQKFAE
ncbi:3140_t:CDS:2 [Acaulospora colombiana]|uniref:3140_t:CDS:1 n=1 Tax=Acaulospora colombiana TaxID=27376 RepID=A0ACA9KYE2_9GLOM|nr:3140_t:CDS:2 [Acaulospora colombiana]